MILLDSPRDTTQYVIPGTDTFRLSSRMLTLRLTKPAREGQVGGNLQNKDKSIRKIYVADKGKIFLQRDQRGAEALIVAYLCRHGNFRELFINGIKSHNFVGLHVFADTWQSLINNGEAINLIGKDIKCSIKELCDLPIRELAKHPFWPDVAKLIQSSDKWPAERRYYYIAKQICHSSNYGIGVSRFILNTLEKSKGRICLEKKQTEYYLAFYHGIFPEIHEWHDETLEQVRATHYLFNLFGYPHYFFHTGELIKTEYKRYYAFIPQSTVGTITNIAYTLLYSHIKREKLPFDLMANTHDSYLVQCPDSQAEIEECNRLMKLYLEPELTSPRGEKFKMQSDASIGYNWGPYDEETNPKGLKDLKE